MFDFLKDNMMVKNILLNDQNIDIYVELMDENTFFSEFIKNAQA